MVLILERWVISVVKNLVTFFKITFILEVIEQQFKKYFAWFSKLFLE